MFSKWVSILFLALILTSLPARAGYVPDIVDSDVDANAAIQFSKFAAMAHNQACISDNNGYITTTPTNALVIGQVLTGYTSGAGTVSATDSLIQAIQKLNGNIAALGTGGSLLAFVLEDATVPFTRFNGVRSASQTETLSAVRITMGNSGVSGSTTIQVNDLTAGTSATASLSASGAAPATTSAALSGSLSITANDVISVDCVSVAGGSPSDLTVSFQ